MDFKANGGYVVIPPSTHINGNTYKIHNDTALADIPSNLLEIILKEVKNNIFRGRGIISFLELVLVLHITVQKRSRIVKC